MSNIYLAIATDTTDGFGVLQFSYEKDTLEIYNFFCTEEKGLKQVISEDSHHLKRSAVFLEQYIYQEIPNNIKFEEHYKGCYGITPISTTQFMRSKRRVIILDETLLIEDLSLFNDCLRLAYGAIRDGKVF